MSTEDIFVHDQLMKFGVKVKFELFIYFSVTLTQTPSAVLS